MMKLNKKNKFFAVYSDKIGKYATVKILFLKIKFNVSHHPFLIRFLLKKIEINPRKIVFNNYAGFGYGCNPKYIAEEILKQKLDCQMVWLYKGAFIFDIENLKKNFPPNISLVEWDSFQALKELSEAKTLVSSYRINPFIERGFKKKREQRYIQTWHGSFGIKKLDSLVVALNVEANRKWKKTAQIDADITDYLLSNGTWETNVLKNGLYYSGPILETAHPRNDVFFKPDNWKEKIKNKVYSHFGIDSDYKTVLYAPTYRNAFLYEREVLDFQCYDLDISNLLESAKQKFGGKWFPLIRFHPRVAEYAHNIFNFGRNILNVSHYDDIQELLVAADIVITDYSSCIFDFMLSKKPAFIFATDIERYNNGRGFYYPLEETPFPVAKNNDDLAKNIKNFDLEKYQKEVEEFLKGKGSIEDGKASQRVVELIKDIIEDKDNKAIHNS